MALGDLLRVWRQPGEDGPRRYKSSPAELKARTEKARSQTRLNRLRRKLQQTTGAEPAQADDYATRLQKMFLCRGPGDSGVEEDPVHGFTRNAKAFGRDRARCVFSLMMALVRAICALVDARGQSAGTFHVLNVVVVDDCSTSMRPSDGGRTVVNNIMNVVETLHVRSDVDVAACESMRVPLPCIILPDGNGPTLWEAFTSIMLVTSQAVGAMLRLYGVPASILGRTAFNTMVFVGDALSANQTAFALEANALAAQRSSEPVCLAIQVGRGLGSTFFCYFLTLSNT